jgi:outer membrane protein
LAKKIFMLLLLCSLKSSAIFAQSSPDSKRYDLDQCIKIALQNNDRSRVSRDSVDMAMAVHRQALSAWWPRITGSIAGTRSDENSTFLFPSSQISVPASAMTVSLPAITLPANLFGPGFPPANVSLPLQPMTINVPAQTIPVPQQNVKLMDRDYLVASVDAVLPIYTGGLRGSRIKQARAGVEAARQEERRTDLEVVCDIKRLYFAAVMGNQLISISRDVLARMEATLELTEKLYKTGSGTVKKTDYLRNSFVVETVRSATAELEGKEKAVRATLLMAMGLDMDSPFTPADSELPFIPREFNTKSLVQSALVNNPEIARIEAAIKAAGFGVKAARSGHFPKVALLSKAYKIGNAYDAGIVTPENKSSWMIGFGVDIPIFDGFRVSNEVAEQQANLRKLQHQLELLRDAVSLQVRTAIFDLIKSQQQQKSSLAAFQSAKENRELNVRAYQEELVETKDVIEAQIYEALLSGQYQQVLYDYLEAQARLEFVIGAYKGMPD